MSFNLLGHYNYPITPENPPVIMINISTGVEIRAVSKSHAISFAKSLRNAKVVQGNKVLFQTGE